MKNEDAVSPVIGVILMVAITVILAAVVAVFGFGFGAMDAKGPTASIMVSSIPDTAGIDMKIVHRAGDTLKAGDWKLSITGVDGPPVFITATTDFQAGDTIITTNLTNSGTVSVTNSAVTVVGIPANFVPDTKYNVKIIVYPYKTQLVDAVVLIR
jgi:flagellin-like protein